MGVHTQMNKCPFACFNSEVDIHILRSLKCAIMSNFENFDVFDIIKVHNKLSEAAFVSPYIMKLNGSGLEFHASKTRWV